MCKEHNGVQDGTCPIHQLATHTHTHRVEALLSSMQVVRIDIGGQLVGVAIQGKLCPSDAVGTATDRAANIRGVGEIVCRTTVDKSPHVVEHHW